MHVEDDGTCSDRLILGDGTHKRVAQDVLHADIDRKPHRLQRRVTGHAERPQIRHALVVDILFHPGHTAIVDVDVTDDVRGSRPTRIEAALFRAEADAGNAEREDLALLLRCQLTAQPLEARIGRQLAIGILDVQILEHRGQPLDGFIGIDDLVRLGKQRDRANVSRQDLTVAIKNIRARRHEAVGGQNAGNGFRLGMTILDEAAADDRIGDTERGEHQPDAGLCHFRLALARSLEGRTIYHGTAALHVGREMRLALQQHDSREKCHQRSTDPVVMRSLMGSEGSPALALSAASSPSGTGT